MSDPLRVAVYARSATTRDAEVVGRQLAGCRAKVERNGWLVQEVFCDTGVSGSENQRPGLDALRSFMRQGRCDIILVESAHRLLRDPDLLRDFIEEADARNIRIECVAPDASLTALLEASTSDMSALLKKLVRIPTSKDSQHDL